MINKEETIKKLKDSSLKITPQRLAIIEYLEGNKCHPTAEEIHGGVKNAYPSISFATVYNTLEALIGIEVVKVINLNSERQHFDPDTSCHHHIVCVECSKIADVLADYSKDLTLPKEVLANFKPIDSEVNFKGLCLDCK